MSGPDPDLRAAILEALAAAKGRPLAPRRIANALGWPRDAWADLEQVVDAMAAAGELVRVRGGKVLAAEARPSITGTFLLTGRGFGFVAPDAPAGGPDYFVPPDATGGAMPGDRVRAVVLPERREGGHRGRRPRRDRRQADRLQRVSVVEILDRRREHWVGTVRRSGGLTFLDAPSMPSGQEPVLDDVGEARQGDRVVARMTRAPGNRRSARMVVERVIGLEADPATDAEVIIEEFRIRHTYPDDGLAQALAATAPVAGAAAPAGREDCRHLWCCTIDPATAKDHDDAVSIEPLPDGWRIGVHIADVAHYVPPGSPCDVEARERGNSVYLLSRVVHMLPEPLAADVCSLRPDVDRYALSCFLDCDADGRTRAWRVAKTVIRSRRRFAYEEVQALLDDQPVTPAVEPAAVEKLRTLRRLTAAMTRQRKAEGGIDLEIPEVRVLLDEHDAPTGTALRTRLDAHRLIEECMLAANRAVARELLRLKLPYLCRAHPDPSDEKLERLAALCEALGYRFPTPHDRHAIQGVADQARKRRGGDVMANAVLRTMEKARYEAEEAAHFALGWGHYTHFTSPIRRYADLRVHQVLTAHLAGRLADSEGRAAVSADLVEACGIASMREVQAEEAERELVKLKLLRLLAPQLGNTLPGRIVAVIERGLFVEITDFHVEGLCKAEDLGNDRYEISKDGFALIGKHGGKAYRLGDDLRVRICAIDLTRRQLDLAPG